MTVGEEGEGGGLGRGERGGEVSGHDLISEKYSKECSSFCNVVSGCPQTTSEPSSDINQRHCL